MYSTQLSEQWWSPTQDLIRGEFKSPWSVPNSEQGKGKESCLVIPAGLQGQFGEGLFYGSIHPLYLTWVWGQ